MALFEDDVARARAIKNAKLSPELTDDDDLFLENLHRIRMAKDSQYATPPARLGRNIDFYRFGGIDELVNYVAEKNVPMDKILKCSKELLYILRFKFMGMVYLGNDSVNALLLKRAGLDAPPNVLLFSGVTGKVTDQPALPGFTAKTPSGKTVEIKPQPAFSLPKPTGKRTFGKPIAKPVPITPAPKPPAKKEAAPPSVKELLFGSNKPFENRDKLAGQSNVSALLPRQYVFPKFRRGIIRLFYIPVYNHLVQVIKKKIENLLLNGGLRDPVSAEWLKPNPVLTEDFFIVFFMPILYTGSDYPKSSIHPMALDVIDNELFQMAMLQSKCLEMSIELNQSHLQNIRRKLIKDPVSTVLVADEIKERLDKEIEKNKKMTTDLHFIKVENDLLKSQLDKVLELNEKLRKSNSELDEVNKSNLKVLKEAVETERKKKVEDATKQKEKLKDENKELIAFISNLESQLQAVNKELLEVEKLKSIMPSIELKRELQAEVAKLKQELIFANEFIQSKEKEIAARDKEIDELKAKLLEEMKLKAQSGFRKPRKEDDDLNNELIKSEIKKLSDKLTDLESKGVIENVRKCEEAKNSCIGTAQKMEGTIKKLEHETNITMSLYRTLKGLDHETFLEQGKKQLEKQTLEYKTFCWDLANEQSRVIASIEKDLLKKTEKLERKIKSIPESNPAFNRAQNEIRHQNNINQGKIKAKAPIYVDSVVDSTLKKITEDFFKNSSLNHLMPNFLTKKYLHVSKRMPYVDQMSVEEWQLQKTINSYEYAKLCRQSEMAERRLNR
jgi:hypothetical protein